MLTVGISVFPTWAYLPFAGSAEAACICAELFVRWDSQRWARELQRMICMAGRPMGTQEALSNMTQPLMNGVPCLRDGTYKIAGCKKVAED